MNAKLHDYLNAPVPRKIALACLAGQAVGNMVVVLSSLRKQAREANVLLADQNERIHILVESIEFLLERSDNDTVSELDENLEFWRVVREAKEG